MDLDGCKLKRIQAAEEVARNMGLAFTGGDDYGK